jgi:hypothetical protein
MILTYETYIESIKEGLIATHNIEKYNFSLSIQLNGIGVNHKINIISKFMYDLEILNSKDLSDEALEFVITLNQNLLGYYPSSILVKNDFGENIFKFDEQYLSNKYSYIKIRFEAKYEDNSFKNTLQVPEYAYHLSPINKKEKISNDGLFPKAYNRMTKHPERIYLFYNLEDYEELLKNLKLSDVLNDIDVKYTLYKAKLSDDMIIHTDPNYAKGFYINETIGPRDLEIIKDDL